MWKKVWLCLSSQSKTRCMNVSLCCVCGYFGVFPLQHGGRQATACLLVLHECQHKVTHRNQASRTVLEKPGGSSSTNSNVFFRGRIMLISFCLDLTFYISHIVRWPSELCTVLLHNTAFVSLKSSTFIPSSISLTVSSFITSSLSCSTSPVCPLCPWMQTADKKTQVTPVHEGQWRKSDTGNVVRGLGKLWCGFAKPDYWGWNW